MESKTTLNRDGKTLVCSWFVYCDVASAVLDEPNLLHFFFTESITYQDIFKQMLLIHPNMLLYFTTDIFKLVSFDDAVQICDEYDLKYVEDRNGEGKIIVIINENKFPLEQRKKFITSNGELIERFANRKDRYNGDFEFGYKVVKITKTSEE